MFLMDQATDPGEHSATGSRSARWRPDKARQREVAQLASVESTRSSSNGLKACVGRSRRRIGVRREFERALEADLGGDHAFRLFNKVYIDSFETIHAMVWI